MNGRRALVTGAGGQLGSDLSELLASDHEVYAALPVPELDITDDAPSPPPSSTRGLPWSSTARPFTTSTCASGRRTAPSRSTRAPSARLAQRCQEAGAAFVHLSTNYVFDGGRAEPYDEDDLAAPQSVYAISKLAGEHLALAYCERSLVVRSAGLYGVHGSASKGGNFVQRMLRRAREQES